jgi:hypothetical protein
MRANLLSCNAVVRLQGRTTKSAYSEQRGSKFNHGEGNRVLHSDPLSEKGGVGATSRTREGNRVLLASKEISIAGVVADAIVSYLAEAALAMFVYHLIFSKKMDGS